MAYNKCIFFSSGAIKTKLKPKSTRKTVYAQFPLALVHLLDDSFHWDAACAGGGNIPQPFAAPSPAFLTHHHHSPLPGLQEQLCSTKGSWEASQDDQSRAGSPPPSLSRTIHTRFHPFARVFLLCAKLLQNYFFFVLN